LRGSPAEYKAGLDLAIERGWLWLHESGTYVKFTQAGSELFAWRSLDPCVSVFRDPTHGSLFMPSIVPSGPSQDVFLVLDQFIRIV
jgi:hypothetical protein